MFIADRLIYLDLHKTGGTQIQQLLAATVGGQQSVQHQRLPPELRDAYVIGSVRNPWDWYVSLWAYGCAGRGWLYLRLARRQPVLWRPFHSGRTLRRARGPLRLRSPLPRRRRAEVWRACYADSNDPALFRTWLARVLDPAYRVDLGEGYARSAAWRAAGLMTYRYLRLYSGELGPLMSAGRPADLDALRAFAAEHTLLRAAVRTERLEEDLIAALVGAGYQLSSGQQALIRERAHSRANRSAHRAAAEYYDPATAQLVAERERLLIERYGYRPPAGTV
ncbi:MAG TPA: hypothetical protein VFS21_03935 [Roseiflexaceae bacterium]|nr:hypothetical protein [Roseiflexaceae bacterium]